jgi:hypothetical protein
MSVDFAAAAELLSGDPNLESRRVATFSCHLLLPPSRARLCHRGKRLACSLVPQPFGYMATQHPGKCLQRLIYPRGIRDWPCREKSNVRAFCRPGGLAGRLRSLSLVKFSRYHQPPECPNLQGSQFGNRASWCLYRCFRSLELSASQVASWKMIPTVCRMPERTRLTPWRRLTR